MKNIKINTIFFFVITSFSMIYGQAPQADSMEKNHKEKMDIIMKKPKIPIKTIGILIYDGYQTLDAMGPYEVLSGLMGVKVFFIAKQKGMVSNQRDLKIQVDTSITEVDKLDILVIPGGAAETFMISQDTAVLNWIKKIDKTTAYTTSVCTGAWILGNTGLLKGKNATTNWYRAEEMLTMYGANFKQQRYVRDGKYWTSAGVTAGMDMALAIINDLMGEKYTQAVMLNLEYDPKPPLNAGSVTNTDKIVIDMMREMYDMGLLPLFEKAKKK
jgi:transcriptional regulator GlxA family with amidase domain